MREPLGNYLPLNKTISLSSWKLYRQSHNDNSNLDLNICKSGYNFFEIWDININPKIFDVVSLGLKFATFSKIDLHYISYNF